MGAVTALSWGWGAQEGVGVPRRGVWALWLMDVLDSSQDDAGLKA